MSAQKPNDNSDQEELATFETDHRDVLNLLERVWRKGDCDTPAAIDSTVIVESPADEASQPNATATSDEHPQQIGRFEIIQLIGHGGHGLVYLAWDPRLKRRIALKIPRPEVIMTEELRRRFLRESELAASLTHPNILPIYEAGNFGPICYIATAFCQGSTLEEWLAKRNQPLSPKTAARIMIILADAVQHAHLRGVIHRDLKPANVLIEESSSSAENDSQAPSGQAQAGPLKGEDSSIGHLWIADFGLAKCIDTSQDPQLSLTQTGSIVGTPAFMSPEQVDGASGGVRTLSDVYSLGAILYYLLSGQPPVRGETLLETLRLVREQTPLPLKRLQKKIPRDLEAICFKCLEKYPTRRYDSAADLSADLQRFIDGTPVVARPLSLGQRVVRWSEQNPLLSFATGAAVLFFILGLVATSIGWYTTSNALGRETRAKQAAELSSLEAEQRYWQAKQTVDEYFTQIATHRLLDVPGLTPLRRELLEKAMVFYQGFLEENAGDDQLVTELAETHFQVARVYRMIGQPSAALEHLYSAQALLDQQIAGGTPSLEIALPLGKTLEKIANAHNALGNLEEGLEVAQQAIETIQPLTVDNLDEPEVWLAYFNSLTQSGLLLRELSKPEQALVHLQEAVEWSELAVETFPEDFKFKVNVSNSRHNLANLLKTLGRMEEAEALADASLADARELSKHEDATFAERDRLCKSLHDRAIYAFMRRDFAAAVPWLEESVQLATELAAIFPDAVTYHSLKANVSGMLAVAYANTQRMAEALDSFALNIEALEQILASDPGSAEAKINLAGAKVNYGATLFTQTDQLSEAQDLLHSAKDLFSSIVDASPDSMTARYGMISCDVNLAGISNSLGDHAAALERASEVKDVLAELLAEQPDNPRWLQLRRDVTNHLAVALDGVDRPLEAIEQWRDYMATSPQRTAVSAELQLAISLVRAGQHAEAAELILSNEEQMGASPGIHAHYARACALLAKQLASLETVQTDSSDIESTTSEDSNTQDSDAANEVESWLDKSMEALRKASELGHFRLQWQLRPVIEHSDFQLLRQRPAFQEWLEHVLESRL